VPRTIAIDDDMRRPAGKRRARKRERGALLQFVLHNLKDVIAGSAAFVVVIAIVVNALFLQAGRHPSPMFASTTTLPPLTPAVQQPTPRVAPVATEIASPLPRPRPSDADARPADAVKTEDPVGDLVRTTSTSGSTGSARVAAVQRALTEYGYGQLKPTGTIGADTQAAIQRFERERKLPITGQMSDRLVRELGLATGKTIQ
jgi:Putative peptidoglycan binding domain